MWAAHKVICIFYHLRFWVGQAMYSAKAVTSCKLASTKSVITEQQAPVTPGDETYPATYHLQTFLSAASVP